MVQLIELHHIRKDLNQKMSPRGIKQLKAKANRKLCRECHMKKQPFIPWVSTISL